EAKAWTRSAARPPRRALAGNDRVSGAGVARRARRRPPRRRRGRAGSRARPPRSSGRPASGGSSAISSLEHEAHASHRADELRLAQLAAQVGDVAVDGVEAGCVRASPDALECQLPGDDAPLISQQELEQIRFAPAEAEVFGSSTRSPGAQVQYDVVEREQL